MREKAKNFFIYLSNNKLLNEGAERFGMRLGAQHVVAGTNIEEAIQSIQELNAQGISCTLDNLGEFVSERSEALAAKGKVLEAIESLHKHEANAHISIKPSQLGLDIDHDFCLSNIKEIVEKATEYSMFVNFDMEDHARLQPSFDIFDEIAKEYDNIGTVIQAYFFRAEEDVKRYQDYRLRLVKGAYKESEEVAYQDKAEIDANYIKLIEWHLLHGKFTSIATHDHEVIYHVQKFVEENNISRDKFEFQMLYGFREDMQKSLAKEGYNFCTYIPFGHDWFGYFMRRLAERPENINLMVKQVFNKKTNTILGVAAGAFFLGRLSKRNRKKKK